MLLNPSAWDLMVDSSGNIAVANDPYSVAQDVASAVRLFLGNLYFDTTQGVPYFQDYLGRPPALSQIKQSFVDAAKTVPEVASAVCFISSLTDRILSGQVQATLQDGTLVAVPIARVFVPPTP